ncbi:GTP cyclohydrolase I [Polynucleobacter ibericus]|uniref:GTP cyclohydrolase I n=1 Tax=Polynucleobacter ibericus TaxID=1819725 RepID=UPI0020410845|nr:GTP cyclohydrolase I [Polynucleobacter ibericus]
MPTKKPAAAKKTVVKKVIAVKKTAPAKKITTAKKTTNTKDEGGLPLSVVIRRRIEAQKARFHANDNISAFIEPGELEGLVDEVAEKMQAVLESLVIDTENDHNTQNTSRRVAKMYVQEVFNGRYVVQPTLTKFPNVSRLNELMIIGPITVRSACSHHLCPIMGRIWIGVLPSKESALIGLSKYSRLTEWVMCRPQIQEEAVVELADMLEKKIKPIGVAVVMDADHFCMQWRGVKDRDSKMINSVMRGAFLKDSNLRREFLALIDRK